MNNHKDIDCYKVLALQTPQPGVPIPSQQEIKEAYRRALLTNHPDKTRDADILQTKKTRYTIDEITFACKTLIVPIHRREHDKKLKLQSPEIGAPNDGDRHSGIDTLDLDELHYDRDKSEWHRDCRCGDTMGFTVNEDDLLQGSDHGELVTECLGCSLRLRVTFAVTHDG